MLCRVCLQDCDQVIQLFKHEQDLNMAEVVGQHFWFEPIITDETTVICKGCWLKIYDFHQFYNYVKKNHDNYVSQLKDSKNLEEDVNIKIKEENVEVETILQMEPNLDVDDNLQSTVGLETNPLEETELCLPVKTDNNSSGDNEFHSSDSECLDQMKRRSTITKKSRIKRRIQKSNKQTPSTTKMRRISTKYDPILIESLIKKHIRMVCDLCVYIGETFSDIIKHFGIEHPEERPYVVCCERKLNQRYLLNQHALKHENPDFFRCHECQKSFVDSSGLRAHILCHHAKEEEKTHACELCPQKFARKLFLELHKGSHVPQAERSFICTRCPTRKGFATEYLLQIHYSMKHKREANVCHVCAKSINDKRCFEKHVRSHHENSGPRLKCTIPGCDSWLKDKDNLKQHLRGHNTEGKTYQCNQCGKICKNSRSLTNHKRNNHSTETFKCEQCDKMFKRAITLKEHMAQHTGQTLYNCPFCARTFNSNANMHSHKKKMHPVEWNEWRKRKCGSMPNVKTELFNN